MGEKNSEVPLKLKLGFSIGEIADMIAYQGFSFLIFTFYFAVMKLPVNTITLIFIVWSIFNAFNDPILGTISDRTKTKKFGGGRRRPWMVVMTVPLAIIMILLFTPPSGNSTYTAIYFFIIICVFDTIYTGWSLNHTSLYPEMFQTEAAREEVGASRRILMVVGLLIAFVLPSLFISDMTNQNNDPITKTQYMITGAVFGVLILIMSFLHLKYGVREPPLEELEAKTPLKITEAFTKTIKNKDFVILCLCSTLNWYVFGLIPLIMPLYGTFVLGIESNSIMISLLLLIAFLASIPGVLFWVKLDAKVGSKKAFMYSTIWWLICFIPLAFIDDYWIAAIMMVFIGFGLGGAPYFLDRNISNVVDEDELHTGNRREASYYGVHALIMRLSTILTVLSVGFILGTNGWQVYEPDVVDSGLITGLKMLISVFPAVALGIALIFLNIFSLDKKKVEDIKIQRLELGNAK